MVRIEKYVINDNLVITNNNIRSMFINNTMSCFVEQSNPVITKNLYHYSIKCWCSLRSEKHNFVGLLLAIRIEKCKLFLVTLSYTNLVITATDIEGYYK